MPVFDQLQRCSFDGLEFPIKSVQIRGQYRYHTHEYLRVDGGINEKLKRGLYRIDIDAVFDANIKGYGILWPDVLAVMRNKFELGITSALVIPTIGTVPAFITEWDQSAEISRVRSGEAVRIPFLEDQTETFLANALVQVNSTSLASTSSHLDAVIADMKERSILQEESASLDILDGVQVAANAILAIKDQTDLYSGLLSSRVANLAATLRQAQREVVELQDCENWPLLYVMQDLHDAAITLARNLVETRRSPRLFVVPSIMTVSDISSKLYGSTAHANEIMLNNDLEDPFAVRAGTRIIWFEAAAT